MCLYGGMRQQASSLKTAVRLLSYREVAGVLGMSVHTIRAWAQQGKLPVVRLTPMSPRIAESDLAKFIADARENSSTAEMEIAVAN